MSKKPSGRIGATSLGIEFRRLLTYAIRRIGPEDAGPKVMIVQRQVGLITAITTFFHPSKFMETLGVAVMLINMNDKVAEYAERLWQTAI